jgi:hypothetical protein
MKKRLVTAAFALGCLLLVVLPLWDAATPDPHALGPESNTSVATIKANRKTYDGKLVQVEGRIRALTTSFGVVSMQPVAAALLLDAGDTVRLVLPWSIEVRAGDTVRLIGKFVAHRTEHEFVIGSDEIDASTLPGAIVVVRRPVALFTAFLNIVFPVGDPTKAVPSAPIETPTTLLITYVTVLAAVIAYVSLRQQQKQSVRFDQVPASQPARTNPERGERKDLAVKGAGKAGEHTQTFGLLFLLAVIGTRLWGRSRGGNSQSPD